MVKPIDLELDAAKRHVMERFDAFVTRVGAIQSNPDEDIKYPDDYTADEFVSDFLDLYYDH